MITNEKIAALRDAAKQAGAQGVLLLTSDPHSGEYLPGHWRTVAWFSGFTGDNSTLVVTMRGSALWSDGRFYVQADKQLAGSEVVSMHDGSAGVPTVEEYLTAEFAAGETLLVDGATVPTATVDKYREALAKSGAKLESKDVTAPLWPGRPSLPHSPCTLLTKAQAGLNPDEKLALIRKDLCQAGATALAVTKLDCTGWLLNLRATDLPCTPLALAFSFVTQDSCTLFLAEGRLTLGDEAALQDWGITIRDYADFLPFIAQYAKAETVLYDDAATNDALVQALRANPSLTPLAGKDPITVRKGVKNETELANLRECHIRDGVAMVLFQMDLEAALAAGKKLTEQDIEGMLQARRGEQPGYAQDSFETIAAYGANAAMMHYHAEGDINAEIEPRGLLLVDTGGQYDCGTTDITRTYPVGPLTENERRYYTWTLQSHIEMARAVWLDYCTGFALDTIAREPLWQHLINYRCGTGHGVGYMSSVHEGPQSLRPRNDVLFCPGMTITDEPGVYEENEVGVRIESELECVAKTTNQYGNWLAFRPLTLVPISLVPVLTEELTKPQIAWLNEYHHTVYETLAPRLSEAAKAWLAEKTAPLAL